MSLRPDSRYNGTVSRGALIESSKGTPGFEILMECDEGTLFHTIWITPKTVEYAAKDFAVLDVTEEQLASTSFLQNELPLMVQGKPICFGTKEEEYKGKKTVRCAWIGKPKAPASSSLESSIAQMFGGKAEDPAPKVPEEDDSLPF